MQYHRAEAKECFSYKTSAQCETIIATSAESPSPKAQGFPREPVASALLFLEVCWHLTAMLMNVLPKILTVIVDNTEVPLSSLAKNICSEFNV